MPFKCISYLGLWQPFIQRSVTICAILVEGIERNKSVKLFEFGTVVQEEMSFKSFRIWSSGGPSYSVERNHLCNFKRGLHGEQLCEVI